MALRSNGTPSENRTDPSDEDAGDKLPKRTQSLKTPKKMVKAEVSLVCKLFSAQTLIGELCWKALAS